MRETCPLQLYGEDLSAEDDLSTTSSDNDSDYDSSFDESSLASYTPTHQQMATITPKILDKGDNGTTSSRPVTPCTSKDLEDVLAVLRRSEVEHGKAVEQSIRTRERILEEERVHEQRKTTDDKPGSISGKSKRQTKGEERTRRRDSRT
jgi:hypothetical protein